MADKLKSLDPKDLNTIAKKLGIKKSKRKGKDSKTLISIIQEVVCEDLEKKVKKSPKEVVKIVGEIHSDLITTVKELKKIAKNLGMKGYSNLNKAPLQVAIMAHRKKGAPVPALLPEVKEVVEGIPVKIPPAPRGAPVVGPVLPPLKEEKKVEELKGEIDYLKWTVKELKNELNKRKITQSLPKNKADLIDYLHRERCDEDKECPNDEWCDMRNNLCLPEDRLNKNSKLYKIRYKGKTIVGSKDTMNTLAAKLGVAEAIPVGRGFPILEEKKKEPSDDSYDDSDDDRLNAFLAEDSDEDSDEDIDKQLNELEEELQRDDESGGLDLPPPKGEEIELVAIPSDLSSDEEDDEEDEEDDEELSEDDEEDCDPEAGKMCSGQDVCDMDLKACFPPEVALQGKDLYKTRINGQLIVGSQDALQKLVDTMGAPAPIPVSQDDEKVEEGWEGEGPIDIEEDIVVPAKGDSDVSDSDEDKGDVSDSDEDKDSDVSDAEQGDVEDVLGRLKDDGDGENAEDLDAVRERVKKCLNLLGKQ